MARGGARALSPVCAYVAERTGSSLSDQQVERLRQAIDSNPHARDEETYVRFLKTVAGASALAELMASISVHKTDLFRDEVQLNAFTRHVLQPLVANTRRPLHLWSAGCATGEEVATLLILLREAGANAQSTVLGTDISAAALKTAKAQLFHPELFRRVPDNLKAKYFRKEEKGYRLIAELLPLASFQQHNLMDRPYPVPPLGATFDVIFCRNVLIYFTEAAFEATVQSLAERLSMGGTLVLSAAEPLLKGTGLLATERHGDAFFYRRVDPSQAPKKVTGEQPRRVTGEVPRTISTELPRTVSSERVAAASVARRVEAPAPEDPKDEASRLFALILEWSAAGTSDAETEAGLRRCLYLDPHLAQARYLLAMLLEQRGARADAAAEYRRALAALTDGRSRSTSFFINDERLKSVCARALERLGYARS